MERICRGRARGRRSQEDAQLHDTRARRPDVSHAGWRGASLSDRLSLAKVQSLLIVDAAVFRSGLRVPS